MGTRKAREVPHKLEGIRRRIEQWRRTRKVGSRIPGPLWAAAVRMARIYGVNRTAQTLRLDYYGLRKRVQQSKVAVADPPGKGVASFLELVPLPPPGACECILDLENAKGAKMRVQLKSITMPDLAALSRSFWNPQP